jgi:hypothetical protein
LLLLLFLLLLCAGLRRETDDSASSQIPLVYHAGPELEEEVKGSEVTGVQFKESESEVRQACAHVTWGNVHWAACTAARSSSHHLQPRGTIYLDQ